MSRYNAFGPQTEIVFMNAPFDVTAEKFGIGQSVPRSEDPVLVRGEGRYTDDLAVPGQLYAFMLRSTYAHGRVRGIDTEAARAMPGVRAIYLAADMAAAGFDKIGSSFPLPNRDGSPMQKPPRPTIVGDHVRYAGDILACVIADSLFLARDAAEAIMIDMEDLPALIDARAATAEGAPLLHAAVARNTVLDYHAGDAAATQAAFARAAHVTRLTLANNRIVISPMEPRAALASYDAAADCWTLDAGSQGVIGLRNGIAKEFLNGDAKRVRVRTGHVGGSFGMKGAVFPEYAPLMHAARALGAPIKWTDERSTSFVSDHHGRASDMQAALALDKDGNFLAVRVDVVADVGAYLSSVTPLMSTRNILKNVVSMYATPAVEVNSIAVFTNKTPIGAYRGAGRPEGNYVMERLIDQAARETGRDRIDLRRRNLIEPAQLPFKAASGETYDSGNFPALLARALAAADPDGFAARRDESASRGKLRGLGIGSYLEVTAPQSPEYGGLRFEEDGMVTIVTGTLDYGQGHATPFAQVLAAQLGIPFSRIRLSQGDSNAMTIGGGTGGSRSIMSSGNAIVKASEEVVTKGRRAAADMLEASPQDIAFEGGRFVIEGTDRSIAVLDLAARMRAHGETLDVAVEFGGVASAYPNGCHICELEVDPDTGTVEILRYTAAHDFGTIVNPMLVDGQMQGGIAQGIGQALLEETIYDSSGQMLTGSFVDYALPRATDTPEGFTLVSVPSPAATNGLGVKGCGEAGCAGSLPAVMNALVDALSLRGITHIDMPATPQKIWRALRQG